MTTPFDRLSPYRPDPWALLQAIYSDPKFLDNPSAIVVSDALEFYKTTREPRNVLDHGFVRLVDYMGDDLDIVRGARVSYDADWRTGESENKDSKLIHYLLSHKHTSPFECVVFTMEIKCPLFVARQWHRHRTWSYNEVSARYTELPEEFYVPACDQITTQHESSKQMRTLKPHEDPQYLQDYVREHSKTSFAIYKEFIRMGYPRELARAILPVGTYTRFFGTVDLHNLFHFLTLRLGAHAQYEIRVYAEAICDIIRSIVPVAYGAFIQNLIKQGVIDGTSNLNPNHG
jgi:thymidylate synthase (FAD)